MACIISITSNDGNLDKWWINFYDKCVQTDPMRYEEPLSHTINRQLLSYNGTDMEGMKLEFRNEADAVAFILWWN